MNRRNFLKLIGVAAIFPKDGIKYLTSPPEVVLSYEDYCRLYLAPACKKFAEEID